MNLYLVVCLVLSAVLYRTEGCCSPDQWEGHIGELGGLARRSMFRPPQLIAKSVALSYDATNKKIAADTETKRGVVKHIADFSEHKAYFIRNTTCKYFNLTKPFKKMCTDNATATGSATFGGGGASLAVNTWGFQVEGLQGFASTTQEGCVPVSEGFFGKIRRDYVILTIGYYNITTGIKDPSIFNHPDTCVPGSGDINTYLDNLEVSEGMKYFASKFNGKESNTNGKYLRYEDKFDSMNNV